MEAFLHKTAKRFMMCVTTRWQILLTTGYIPAPNFGSFMFVFLGDGEKTWERQIFLPGFVTCYPRPADTVL